MSNLELIGQYVTVTYADDGSNHILAKRGTLVSLEVQGDAVEYVLEDAEVLRKGTGQWRPIANEDGKVEGYLSPDHGTLKAFGTLEAK